MRRDGRKDGIANGDDGRKKVEGKKEEVKGGWRQREEVCEGGRVKGGRVKG